MVELLTHQSADHSPQPLPNTSPDGPPRDDFDATPKDVAERYNVSAAWVRAHSEELGGRRLGSGPKAQHRFNLTVVGERLADMQGDRSHAPTASAPTRSQPRSRRRSKPTQVELLPIKGRRPPL